MLIELNQITGIDVKNNKKPPISTAPFRPRKPDLEACIMPMVNSISSWEILQAVYLNIVEEEDFFGKKIEAD